MVLFLFPPPPLRTLPLVVDLSHLSVHGRRRGEAGGGWAVGWAGPGVWRRMGGRVGGSWGMVAMCREPTGPRIPCSERARGIHKNVPLPYMTHLPVSRRGESHQHARPGFWLHPYQFAGQRAGTARGTSRLALHCLARVAVLTVLTVVVVASIRAKLAVTVTVRSTSDLIFQAQAHRAHPFKDDCDR